MTHDSQQPSPGPAPHYGQPPYGAAPAPAAPIDSRTRTLSIVMLVLAVLLLVGTFTSSWFTAERGEGGVGLSGVEVCRGSECRTVSWGDMKRGPKDLSLFGMLGMLGGLAAVGVTVATGVMGLTGKAGKIPLKAFTVPYGIAAFSMSMFFMRVFTEFSRGLSVGYSGFLAIGALIAASVLLRMLAKPTAPAPQPWPAR